MTLVIDGTNGVTLPDSTAYYTAASFGWRNKIINGAMVIDQRNAGASVTQTTSTTYTVDRWASYGTVTSKFTAQQNAGSVTPPAGYSNYLGCTSSSAYAITSTDRFQIAQPIEGYNMADLAWGTASAKSVTLSFQVYSSLTGTFGGAVFNYNGSRSYPFSYTISSANTWTSISVTIAGDTTGTWFQSGSPNAVGLNVCFSLGAGSTLSGTAGAWAGAFYVSATGATSVVGTNGATFYITGVQLERGTVATPFEYRNYQQELAMCQRYFERSYDIGTASGTASTGPSAAYQYITASGAGGTGQLTIPMKVTKRAAPTVTIYSIGTSGASGYVYDYTSSSDKAASTQFVGTNAFVGYATTLQVGVNAYNWGFQWTATAEL